MSQPSPQPGIRVLVVADDATALVGELASGSDDVVYEAVDPTTLEETVRAADGVDCLVCLHDPPAVDGVAVVTTLRQEFPTLPLLVATDSTAATDVVRAGPTDIIQLTDGRPNRDVATHRIRSLVAQARQRGTYEQLFERANDGIIVHDADSGAVLQTNRRLYEILGYDPASSDLELEDIVAGVEGYTEANARELVREVAADGPQTFEWLDERADGDRLWVEVSLEVAHIGGVERVLGFVRDITSRKQRQRLLRDRERQLEAVFDHPASVAVVLDDEGRVIRTNEAVREYADADAMAGALEGAPLWELPLWSHDDRVREQVRDAVERARTEGTYQAEFRLEGVGVGTERVVDFRFEAVEDDDQVSGVVVQGFDVTERWERERHLTEIRTELEQTLERVDDAFFALDEEFYVTYVNEAGGEVLREAMAASYSDDELVGKHLWEEVPEAVDTTFDEQYHAAMRDQKPVSFEEYYEPLDVWFEVHAYPDENGLSVFFRDVTERRERREKLDDLLEATRRFNRVNSVGDVYDLIVEESSEALGHEMVLIRRHDEQTGMLNLARLSEAAREHLSAPPAYDREDGPAGEAMRSGEPVVVDDLSTETAFDYGSFESAIVLPLGSHGTVGIGALESEAFTHEEAALVELLALAATGALDRLEQERETRQLSRALAHTDQLVFLLDEDARVTFASDRFVHYLGSDRERLVGRPLADLLTDAERATTAIDSLANATPDETRTFETGLVGADGDLYPVEVELSRTTDSETALVAGAVTDISELAATRSDLEHEQNRFEQLFESLPDPAAEVEYRDGSPVVTHVNDAFRAQFDHGERPVVDESLRAAVDSNDDDGHALSAETSGTDVAFDTTEVELDTADGRRHFLVRVVPYVRAGVTRSFVLYTDITEHKERERYLEVINRVLRHNIRNDLTVIMGLANQVNARTGEEVERETTLLHDKAQGLADASARANEMQELVGRRVSDTYPVALDSCLRAVVGACRDEHPEARVTLDVPDEVWVEATETIRRAFEEIAENALDHNPTETPRLEIEVAADRGRDDVEIRFHDDGPGIQDEEWEIVSGEREITQLSHMSGVGLWITKWLVQTHGGELRRQDDGDGTTIEVVLHRATPDSEQNRVVDGTTVQD